MEYCQGRRAAALTATGDNLKWYAAASGGSPLAGAPTPSTAAAGTTPYFVSQTQNGCESNRAQITVNVKAIPAAPTAASPVELCQGAGAAPLTATGDNLQWYAAASGGSPLAGAPTPSTAAAGTTSYFVSQTVNGCEGPRKSIDVTVKPKPAPPGVTATYSYCFGAVHPAPDGHGHGPELVRGQRRPAGRYRPHALQHGRLQLQGHPDRQRMRERQGHHLGQHRSRPQPPAANAPVEYCQGGGASALTATGDNLKWYAAASGGYPAGRSAYPLHRRRGQHLLLRQPDPERMREQSDPDYGESCKPIPAAPTAASPVELCQGAGAAPLTATGDNLQWYAASSGGSPLAGAPTPSTAAAGTTSYFVSQTVNGCEGPRKAIDVTVKPKPAPPGVTATYSYCFGASIPPLTASGTGLTWYAANDAPLGSTAPTPSNTAASSYKVTQTVNGCESDKATISVIINQTPLPGVNATVEYCQGAGASALTATGDNLKWYAAASGGSPLAGAPTPSTAAAGTTSYFVSQTQNGCEGNRAQINVTVKPTPPAPSAASPVELCQGAGAAPLTATGDNLKWYAASSGGSPLAGAPTPSTAAAGTTSYFVSQTVNGCEGPRKGIDVTIKPKPTPPGVTATYVYCFGATVAPLTATGTGLTWYAANDAPLGSTAPTPSNTAASSYKVTQTVNGCESDKATITISIVQTPPPGVVATIEYCQGQAASALTASGDNLKWYAAPSGGSPLAVAPTPSTAATGTTSYFVSQTQNGCEGNRAQINVTVKSTPGAPTVTTPLEICQGTGAAPLTATGTNLLWYHIFIRRYRNFRSPNPCHE